MKIVDEKYKKKNSNEKYFVYFALRDNIVSECCFVYLSHDFIILKIYFMLVTLIYTFLN